MIQDDTFIVLIAEIFAIKQLDYNHISSFPLCECEPGAYRIQLRYGLDNYDIKMYLKKIRGSEGVRYVRRLTTNLNHCLHYFQ